MKSSRGTFSIASRSRSERRSPRRSSSPIFASRSRRRSSSLLTGRLGGGMTHPLIGLRSRCGHANPRGSRSDAGRPDSPRASRRPLPQTRPALGSSPQVPVRSRPARPDRPHEEVWEPAGSEACDQRGSHSAACSGCTTTLGKAPGPLLATPDAVAPNSAPRVRARFATLAPKAAQLPWPGTGCAEAPAAAASAKRPVAAVMVRLLMRMVISSGRLGRWPPSA